MIDFDTFTKLPKNVGELDKLIVNKGFEKLPKVQKSPNLVTLVASLTPLHSKEEIRYFLQPWQVDDITYFG